MTDPAAPRPARHVAGLRLGVALRSLPALMLLFASRAEAEPYLALRSGLPCSACHVNVTGGGQRTRFGVDYGLEKLPQWNVALPEGQDYFRGVLGSHLLVGADYRGANAARSARSGSTNSFQTQEGNLYADLALLPDRLHLYADVRVAPGAAQSRELFALVERLPGSLYVKMGRFFAPFGWRLLDDGAFIRARTGFTFQSPDDGIEVGWLPGRFAVSLAFTNGNGGAADDDRNKRVSLVSAWTRPKFRLGGSFASNRQGEVSTLMGGLLGGVSLGPRLVALAEVDVVREEGTAAEVSRQIVAFLEADLLLGRGWNLKAAFDYVDPTTSEDGDEVNRITLGGELFATQYVQLRLLWRRTDRPPEVHGARFEDDREALVELHLHL